jgi:hypothetical protein
MENKCLIFNLPPNYNKYESSAKILYGGLINSNISSDISYQLGGKLSNIHILGKNKGLEKREFLK